MTNPDPDISEDENEGWPMRVPGPKMIRLECIRIVAEHASSWTLESLAKDALFLAEVVETGRLPDQD